jgi:hypothetical protein
LQLASPEHWVRSLAEQEPLALQVRQVPRQTVPASLFEQVPPLHVLQLASPPHLETSSLEQEPLLLQTRQSPLHFVPAATFVPPPHLFPSLWHTSPVLQGLLVLQAVPAGQLAGVGVGVGVGVVVPPPGVGVGVGVVVPPPGVGVSVPERGSTVTVVSERAAMSPMVAA